VPVPTLAHGECTRNAPKLCPASRLGIKRRSAHARGWVVNLSRLFQVFLVELRRRRILRVLAIYAVAAWLALQVAEVTFEPLGFSQGAMRALILVALAGFPVMFVLAWLIELSPEGFMFDLPLWPRPGEAATRSRRLDPWMALVLVGVLGFGIYSAVSMLEPAPDTQRVANDRTRNSIAVLPFENFDGGKQSDYFSGGLAEEILFLLAELPELDVAARTSSFQFRGTPVDVREIASTLGVSKVLEGSVQRDGDRLQVKTQLVDGETGYQRWQQSYQRELADIFAIQREIAEAVVEELRINLSSASVARLQTAPTGSLEAYLLYLQGSEKLRSSQDPRVVREAGELFMQALALDPDFARALAGRCEVGLRLYEIGRATAEFEQAQADCTRASALDGGLNVEVQVAMARLYRFRGWHERADRQLQNALAIAPRNVDAQIELGALRAAQGLSTEAEASLLRAVDLKPNYWKAYEALAGFYYRNERYLEAVQAYAIVARLAPNMASAHAGLGAAHWMLGKVEESRVAWDRSLALDPSRQAYTNLGLRYYYAGHFDKAADMQRQALVLAPDDHRVWGRLAESLRQLGGHEDESREAYGRAAELARSNLEINDSDWSTRGLLGLYQAYGTQPALGQAEVDRAVADSNGAAEALYYQALVRVRQGDVDGTIEALERAVAKDPQYRTFVISDPDFKPLQWLPRFQQLSQQGIDAAAPGGP
jgi:TolB-like protein/Tfp pilus assembly protein PilF